MLVHTGLPAEMLPFVAGVGPPSTAFVSADTVARATRRAPQANGLLLGLAAAPDSQLLAALRRLRRTQPWLPIVSLVDGEAERAAPELLAAGADRVLAVAALRVDPALAEAVAADWARLPLRRLAAVVRFADHVAPDARHLMVAGLRSPRLFSTVEELAQLADRNRSSMWKLWLGSRRQLPTIGVFIDWLHLLAVVSARHAEEPWPDVITRIGARPSPVARLARQVLGRTLGQAREPVRDRIFRAFLQQMVRCTASETATLLAATLPALDALPAETLAVPRRRPRRDLDVDSPATNGAEPPAAHSSREPERGAEREVPVPATLGLGDVPSSSVTNDVNKRDRSPLRDTSPMRSMPA